MRDDDITKKPDLLGSIVGIVPVVEDMEVLQQTYLIVGYLLKSNFDSVSFDLDFAERFVGVSRGVLEKGGVDAGVYSNLVKVLGILAGQSLITLRNLDAGVYSNLVKVLGITGWTVSDHVKKLPGIL